MGRSNKRDIVDVGEELLNDLRDDEFDNFLLMTFNVDELDRFKERMVELEPEKNNILLCSKPHQIEKIKQLEISKDLNLMSLDSHAKIYLMWNRDFLIYSGYLSNPLIQTDLLVLFSLCSVY